MFYRASLLRLAGLLAGSACLVLAVGVAAEVPPPTDWSDADKERFLLGAEIVGTETLPSGVTESLRATLSDGIYTHDAHVQTIDLYRKKFRTARRTYVDFRDTYRYNVAAYRIDRLLGLGMVPVSVERTVGGDRAAVTWWVDDVLMSVLEKHHDRVQPPDLTGWTRQRFQGRIFNQLIYNTDAHLGNHLITSDWRLWLVDFTRAFRIHKKLPDRKELGCVERPLYDALRGLTADSLEAATAGCLTGRERKALMARRDRLVEHFRSRLEKEGAELVFCGQLYDRR